MRHALLLLAVVTVVVVAIAFAAVRNDAEAPTESPPGSSLPASLLALGVAGLP